MKQRLMALYFTEGADLTDREVLVKAAADAVELDADQVRALLASDTDVERVTQRSRIRPSEGRASRACRCFIFGGMLSLSPCGAQSPEHLVSAMDRAIAERQKREATQAAVVTRWVGQRRGTRRAPRVPSSRKPPVIADGFLCPGDPA